jgi:hypothetical protein
MNGVFPADLAVYLLLAPVVAYIFVTHRWAGFLPWYYLSVFCLARIVGGILGICDSESLAANIIQSVGILQLILGVDGLVHEAYVHTELVEWFKQLIDIVEHTAIHLAPAFSEFLLL